MSDRGQYILPGNGPLVPEVPLPPEPPPEDDSQCANPACSCRGLLSPWAQEILDRCKAEGRQATEEERAVLIAELLNLGDAALLALGLGRPQ